MQGRGVLDGCEGSDTSDRSDVVSNCFAGLLMGTWRLGGKWWASQWAVAGVSAVPTDPTFPTFPTFPTIPTVAAAILRMASC